VSGGDGGDAFEESLQLSASNRVLQFPNGFGFDLSHSFTSHFEDATDFFQRVGVTIA
jgi:hypothetical protein